MGPKSAALKNAMAKRRYNAVHGGTFICKHKSICFEAKVRNIRYGGNRKVYPPPTPTRPLGITRPLPDITPTRLNPIYHPL